jgi:hypothetical protein
LTPFPIPDDFLLGALPGLPGRHLVSLARVLLSRRSARGHGLACRIEHCLREPATTVRIRFLTLCASAKINFLDDNIQARFLNFDEDNFIVAGTEVLDGMLDSIFCDGDQIAIPITKSLYASPPPGQLKINLCLKAVNQLFFGDNLAVMSGLQEKSVDFRLFDPPYNTGSKSFPYLDHRPDGAGYMVPCLAAARRISRALVTDVPVRIHASCCDEPVSLRHYGDLRRECRCGPKTGPFRRRIPLQRVVVLLRIERKKSALEIRQR